MCLSLGYPDEDAERELLEGRSRRELVDELTTVVGSAELIALREQVAAVKASASVLDYLQRLLAYSRHDGGFSYGLSPRAGLSLLRAAKAWALLENRDFLIHEDVQAVLASVVDHRLQPLASRKLLEYVPVLA
jgi:MoxR-like ATPase